MFMHKFKYHFHHKSPEIPNYSQDILQKKEFMQRRHKKNAAAR